MEIVGVASAIIRDRALRIGAISVSSVLGLSTYGSPGSPRRLSPDNPVTNIDELWLET